LFLKKEAKFCHSHYVIVKFIGLKPHLNIVHWVVDVNQKVQTRKISLEMDLFRGFFIFKMNGPLPTKKKKRSSCLPSTREIGECASTMNGFLDLI
jgi:hypothetical protein